MPNITLSLPAELFQYIKEHKEIRWSEIARRAMEEFKKKLDLIQKMELEEKRAYLDNLLKDSDLTEEDAMRLGDQVKAGIHEKRSGKLNAARN
jgi:hypothetical protein